MKSTDVRGFSAPPKTDSKSETWETSETRVESWPGEGRLLKRHDWIWCLYQAGDVILALLPLYFILLGAAVVALNKKPTKDNAFGRKVEFAIDLGPTIFPIVFAAVIGRCMKMFARYLAEKGARISTLELLMASQSVWGTVESQLLMQRLTVVGANLLFLWALSPLGGQASLRLMTRDHQATETYTKLRYMTTGPAGTAWGLATTYADNGKFADAGSLYGAALLAPQATKTGPRDIWGNVKIPRLEAFNMSKADSAGWITVPSKISTPETFSSLVGLPIVGLASDRISNFALESSYISVSCGRFNQTAFPGVDGHIGNANWTAMQRLIPGQVWTNTSQWDPFHPLNRTTSFFIDSKMPLLWDPQAPEYETLKGRFDGFIGHLNRSVMNEGEIKTSRDIFYVSLYATTPDQSQFGLNIASCSLSQHHVEVMVRCDGEQCAAEKMRTSLSDNRTSSFTGFDNGPIMTNFAERFPIAIDASVGSSPTERFLANSSSFPFLQQVGYAAQDVAYVNLSLVPPETFSTRLSVLLNTYYQLSMQPTGYFGSLTTNLTKYGPDTLPAIDIDAYLPKNLSATDHTFSEWWPSFQAGIKDINSPFIGATTTATVTMSQEIFLCNFAWFALLMASSCIILIIGGVALVLKRKTLGPEMFGFVSSMTYQNPHMKIAEGGSTLDAMERARLLKDVKVYIGDVRGEKDVGYISLAAGVPLRRLERGRLYA